MAVSPTFTARNAPLLAATVIVLFCVFLFAILLKWNGLSFSVKAGDLTSLLAPLAFAAAVVERSVEILISPWRDAGASKLEKIMSAIKARPVDPNTDAANASALQVASDTLDDYKGETQRYAFAVSVSLSILVSIAGVRALQPFLDSTKFHDASTTSPAQQMFFLCVDVTISAALLSGGADGIHSVVNAVTSFFDASASKAKQ